MTATPHRWLPSGRALRLLRERRNAMPVVGAGASGAAGLPNGVQLARFMRGLDMAEGIRFLNPDHCMDVATEIVGADVQRRRQLNNAVADYHRLSEWPNRRSTRVHQALVRTPSRMLITFNYDLLFEEAAAEQGIDLISMTRADLVGSEALDHLTNPDPDVPLRIMHIHGSVDTPDEIVLDGTSYREHAEDPRVGHFLAAAFSRFNACFIGFGFDEAYFMLEMQRHARVAAKHVVVTDQAGADAMTQGRGAVSTPKHGIVVEAFPEGDWACLDEFAEWLTQPAVPGPVQVRLAPVTHDNYTPNRIVAFEPDEPASARRSGWAAALGLIEVQSEQDLAIKHRTVVRGSPGAGKTELLRRVGYLAPNFEQPVLVRLGSLPFAEGQTLAETLACWLQDGERFGDVGPITAASLDERHFHILIDGLDEVPSSRQTAVAELIRGMAVEFPQHRFTIAARPVAALSVFDEGWELFRLAPDQAFRRVFLAQFDLTWGDLLRQAPALGDLDDLMQLPFFLQAVVDLTHDDRLRDFASPLDLIREFIDLALATPELRAVQEVIRPWLERAAVEQLLSDTGGLSRASLEAVPVMPAPDPEHARSALDLLVDRTLLEASGTSYRFVHRLLAEALAAEMLLKTEPSDALLDYLAPVVSETVSGVREQWAVPVALALPLSQPWRAAISARDEMAAARTVPLDAAVEERERAARTIWGAYTKWRIWIHPRDTTSVLHDGIALARLLKAGDLPDVVGEVVSALHNTSRQVRSNAVEVLALSEHPDLSAFLRSILLEDADAVVRRQAANAAARNRVLGVFRHVKARALDPADDPEAQDMGRALAVLCPREELLNVALSLVRRGGRWTWPLENAIEELGEPTAMLRVLEEQVRRRRDRFSVGRSLVELVPRLDWSDDLAVNSVGYVAAAARCDDPSLIALATKSPRAFLSGMLDAIADGTARSWPSIIPYLEAFPIDLLELFGAPEGVLSMARRQSPPDAIDVTERVRELEAQADEPRLAKLLERGDAASLNEVLGNVRYFEDEAKELPEAGTRVLAELIQNRWPRDGLATAIEKTGPNRWQIEYPAEAVLRYGPAIGLSLTPQQWAEVAMRGFSFGSENDWLRDQWTPDAMQTTLDSCVDERAEIWANILASTPDPVPRELVEAIQERVRTDDLQRGAEIIHRLGEAGEIQAVTQIVAHNPELNNVALPTLAATGDEAAQGALLADLADRFATTTGIDSEELWWMRGITDPNMLPALFELLPASYNHDPGPGGLNDTMGVLHQTIRKIGGQEVVDLYDELLAREEPAWTGMQFVRLYRDEVARDLLAEASQNAEPAFRRELLGARPTS